MKPKLKDFFINLVGFSEKKMNYLYFALILEIKVIFTVTFQHLKKISSWKADLKCEEKIANIKAFEDDHFNFKEEIFKWEWESLKCLFFCTDTTTYYFQRSFWNKSTHLHKWLKYFYSSDLLYWSQSLHHLIFSVTQSSR